MVCAGIAGSVLAAGQAGYYVRAASGESKEAQAKEDKTANTMGVSGEISNEQMAADEKKVAYDRIAPPEEQLAAEPIAKYGMLPIYGRDVKDGVYPVEVKSSSTMFQITEAVLTVEDGEMTAAITLSGQGYLKLFPGTSEEAAASGLEDYIGYTENAEGLYTYEVPVESLDRELPLAAFSKRKEQWYDRRVLFDAETLPKEALLVELPDYDLIENAVARYEGQESDGAESAEDEHNAGTEEVENETASGAEEAGNEMTAGTEEVGNEMTAGTEEAGNETAFRADKTGNGNVTGVNEIESEGAAEVAVPASIDMEDGEYAIDVTLTGGSGKASVSSPTVFIVRDGKAYARLQWSSSNYDYMIVGMEKYLNCNAEGGNSVFEIPVAAFDTALPVIADTTAMGTPHEVEYTLIFYAETIGPKSQLPQEAAKKVVYIALVIIVGGGILNHILKKRRAG